MSNLDLAKLLPPSYRNKTLDTLIRASFNQHLTKDDSENLYGYVGSDKTSSLTDVYLKENELERQVNQLTPILYSKFGSEESLITWTDIIQRLSLEGISRSSLKEWLSVESLNFIPFIDLDKFSNYQEYVWIGQWYQSNPTLPWETLGISNQTSIALSTSNSKAVPDYYVIQKGSLSGSTPDQQYPGLLTPWSHWALGNLWIHREDALVFQSYHPILSTSDLTQALRPIIEYDNRLKLSLYTNNAAPSDSGTFLNQRKYDVNQVPLFDLYYSNGDHTKYISGCFFYKESSSAPIDQVLGRRIVKNSLGDLTFSHSFISPNEDRPFFIKKYNSTTSSFDLSSPWESSSLSTIDNVKYENYGTIINSDKLFNYKNYYWSGADNGLLPTYNIDLRPEYVVIESGGSSGWSLDNRWMNVNSLTSEQKKTYVQAVKPIIEFNNGLEEGLISPKTTLAQQPKFNLYSLDSSNQYQLSNLVNNRWNSSYFNELFVNVNDLTTSNTIINSDANHLSNLVSVESYKFAQSMILGYYDYQLDNGNIVPYSLREFDRSGNGDGQIVTLSMDQDAIPQVITLTGLSATTFNVVSTIFGNTPILTVGVPYSIGGSTFTISEGVIPFDTTTLIRFDVKSILFKTQHQYVKINGSYKSINLLSDYTSLQRLEDRAVLSSSTEGAWKVPDILFGNLNSITKSDILHGDLFSHFTSIIKNQVGFIGYSDGNNNWRNLSKNYSLGGTIKTYNNRLPLLLGLLSQKSITVTDLLEFSQISYQSVLNKIREFVENYLVESFISNSSSFVSTNFQSIDVKTYSILKSFIEKISSVVSASTNKNDDKLNQPFNTSSLPIKALTLTAPYLGLVSKTLPGYYNDVEENQIIILHHDGHKSFLPIVDFDVSKRLVLKKFKRTDGTETAGIIGGPTPPSSAYRGQLWLDLAGEKLYLYDVVSDTGNLPIDALAGQYSYNKITNELWQYNGIWNSLGTNTSTIPWRLINFNATLAGLIVQLETELYNHCPVLSSPINIPLLQSNTRYNTLLQKEFEEFCSTSGILNPYENNYDPTNPFTWNYQGTGLGISNPAMWHDVYRETYGTSRPDLYPYISAGFTSESLFINDLIANSIVPIGTTSFDISLWTNATFVSYMKSKLSTLGKPLRVSVNLTNGTLLPPYSEGNPERLSVYQPPNPLGNFEFGKNGQIEKIWRRSVYFNTAKIKTYFRIDPLSFIHHVWGDELVKIGNYEITNPIGRKSHISDVLIHGEVNNRVSLRSNNVNIVLTSTPFVPTNFIVEIISVKQKLVKVTNNINSTINHGTTTSFSLDGFGSGSLSESLDGFNLGDRVIINVTEQGVITKSIRLAGIYKFEGLSQIYSHYHNYHSLELSYSKDKNLLSNWEIKTGYRFNGLVDSQLSVKLENSGQDLSNFGFKVYLKENELNTGAWLTGLSITLIQIGSTSFERNHNLPAKSSNQQRGDDWIYRVDLMNEKHRNLEWYEYDQSTYRPFYALNQKSSFDEWKRFTTKSSLISLSGPFIVKGLQNLITFLFGYQDRLEELGFKTTGTPSWQDNIEYFIDSQFNNPSKNSKFNLRPFEKELFFKSELGFVSDLSKDGSSRLTPRLYTVNGIRITKDQFRVFRDGSETKIVSDVMIYGAFIATSLFEHIVLLDNEIGSTIINDPFTGKRLSRLFLSGLKQKNSNGRPYYNGKYLSNGQMKTNMEGIIQQFGQIYDLNSKSDQNMFDHASSIISFEKKSYLTDIGVTTPTQIQFWKGLLKSKGTNRAIDSYVNSNNYRSAEIDEFWAYKIADYGDLRIPINAELNINAEDVIGDSSNFLLLEKDELKLIDGLSTSGGFDTSNFGIRPMDAYTIYTQYQSLGMDYIDPRGQILILPDDEQRWNSFSDLGSISYLSSVIIGTMDFVPLDTTSSKSIRDINRKLILADTFEIVDLDSTTQNIYNTDSLDINSYLKSGSKIYRERGEYIVGSNPPNHNAPKFKRINSSRIQILDQSLIGKRLRVICYGPPIKKFTPSQIYRYDLGYDVSVNKLIWWDPARDVHSPEAYAAIDYKKDNDPARYTQTLLDYKTKNSDPSHQWTDSQVGKIWWNTGELDYIPYHDAKIFENYLERISLWGAISDWSSIRVNEWVESELHPSEYPLENLGVKNYLSRTRSWNVRPIVWLKSTSLDSNDFNGVKESLSDLNLFNDKIVSLSGVIPKFKIGENISSMEYINEQRTTHYKPSGFGTIINDQVDLVLGSSNNVSTPTYITNVSITNLTLTVTNHLLSYGKVQLTNELEVINLENNYFVRATVLGTNMTQRILIQDSPIDANTIISLDFDLLGFKITCNNIYSQNGVWGVLGTLSRDARTLKLVQDIGNNHDLFLRQSMAFKTILAFTSPSLAVNGKIGWTSWFDPESLTLEQYSASNNRWKALNGDWSLVENVFEHEKYIHNEIKLGLPVSRYSETVGYWKKIINNIQESVYIPGRSQRQFSESMSFSNTTYDEISKARLFVNGLRILDFNSSPKLGADGYYLTIPRKYLISGTMVRVIIPAKIPTQNELNLKLSRNADAVTVMTEYALDYPHNKVELKNEFGRVYSTKYYFWVTNKETPAKNKSLPIKLIAQQLQHYQGQYIIPQIMKKYDQRDGRPNRYAMICLKGLSGIIRQNYQFKLRITENGSMRNSDENLSLRTIHSEWKLIRKNQSTKIPRDLWNKLVDTLAGETATGLSLPFTNYSLYDERNNKTSRFGLKQGQILTDINLAKASIKSTLLNTQVKTFDSTTGSFKASPLVFNGFVSSNIDLYLATSSSIREFMENIWNFGQVKNINELFFVLLEDAMSESFEIADIFKTSYISLDEVRTVIV